MQRSITCLHTTPPLSAAPLLILTLIQEQPGQVVTEKNQSFASLPFSINETQPHPNIWSGATVHTTAILQLQVEHSRRMFP